MSTPAGGLDHDIAGLLGRVDSETRALIEAWVDGAVARAVARAESEALDALVARLPFEPALAPQPPITPQINAVAGPLYTDATAMLINNLKTRVAELEARLGSLGLIA